MGTESAKAKLTYVNGRGRAEVVRYVLSAAGIEFTEDFLTSGQDLNNLRESGKLIFRQVPLLEIEGNIITQTEAMIRYIARNHDLYGSSEAEMIRCDMIYDALKDSGIGISGISYIFKSEEDKAATKILMKEKIQKYFPMFEKLLSANAKNLFVGDKISFVDVVFLHDLEWLVDILGANELEAYPTIKSFQTNLQKHPNIAKYLASEQKKKFPDAAYVQLVRSVFYS